jgi:23S rRNA (adenine2503-C2)-methyltransferase
MRNLNADEIFDQVKLIDRQSRTIYNRPLSNIVFMGMGEPLMNYNNVLQAIEIITSKDGLHMSPKRITLSTSGIPKLIKKLADDNAKINLALSLHSARQEVREQIMPFAKKFPIEDLIDALQYWYSQTKSRVTLEYLVWKGVNDTQADIKALLDFCKKTVCKVNIIEYNSIDDDKFQQAENATIEAYVRALEAQKVTVTVRRSRGKDIDAACGQLANKSVNL